MSAAGVGELWRALRMTVDGRTVVDGEGRDAVGYMRICVALVYERAEVGILAGPEHGEKEKEINEPNSFGFLICIYLIDACFFSTIMSEPLASSANGRTSGKPWKIQKSATVYVFVFFESMSSKVTQAFAAVGGALFKKLGGPDAEDSKGPGHQKAPI